MSNALLRTIPQAGYIKLGSIRYGVQITNLNLQDYPLPTSLWTTRSNKPAILSAETASSSIMSPSANNNAKAICSDECCCCISSSSTSSKTRLPISQSGERESRVRARMMNEEGGKERELCDLNLLTSHHRARGKERDDR